MYFHRAHEAEVLNQLTVTSAAVDTFALEALPTDATVAVLVKKKAS